MSILDEIESATEIEGEIDVNQLATNVLDAERVEYEFVEFNNSQVLTNLNYSSLVIEHMTYINEALGTGGCSLHTLLTHRDYNQLIMVNKDADNKID